MCNWPKGCSDGVLEIGNNCSLGATFYIVMCSNRYGSALNNLRHEGISPRVRDPYSP